MNPDKLQELCQEICNETNYPMPKYLTLNNRLRTTLGLCYKETEAIELNEYVVRNNPKKVIRAILAHEICHLRHFNHFKEFEVAVKLMGSALSVSTLFPNIKIPFKYEYRCPVCNNSFYWDKRRNTSCGICYPEKYNRKYKLRLVSRT